MSPTDAALFREHNLLFAQFVHDFGEVLKDAETLRSGDDDPAWVEAAGRALGFIVGLGIARHGLNLMTVAWEMQEALKMENLKVRLDKDQLKVEPIDANATTAAVSPLN